MPKRMNNYERLKHMDRVEMAEELTRMSKSSALPYADFGEWLNSSETTLRPKGNMVRAIVFTRHNQTHQIVDMSDITCIIISDKARIFHERYYMVWDIATESIKSIPFSDFEIQEVMWNE